MSNIDSYFENLKNKKILVIGVGISNYPLIETLKKEGVQFIKAIDRGRKITSDNEKLLDNVKKLKAEGLIDDYYVGTDYLEHISDCDIIFKTPGLRGDAPQLVSAREKGILVTSEMEEFIRLCPCKKYGITGSDGKTTTTTLTFKFLEKEFSESNRKVFVGGNIGTPLFPKLREMTENDAVVLELSSFQLMNADIKLDTALITNITPNHLDWHKDYQEYCEAKKNVYNGGSKDMRVVLNMDNDITFSYAKENSERNIKLFSRSLKPENGAYFDGKTVFAVEKGEELPVIDADKMLIPGLHNVENFMAALCAVWGDVSVENIREVITSFKGVAHRIEPVREINGVKFYNSSIDSSPNRSIKALSVFKDKNVIMIAGGKDKGIPYDALGPMVCDKVVSLYLIGPTAGVIRKSVTDEETRRGTQGSVKITELDSYEEAVKMAAAEAKPGNTVILSPASTSFDRFANFEERGNLFKKLVNEL